MIHPPSFIAPNSTIIGEVYTAPHVTVWGNAVIRGDINSVNIGRFSSIGEGTVIFTSGSLPNGLSSAVEIGENVVIGAGCTLHSC